MQLVWPVCCPICGALGEQVCADCFKTLLQPVPLFCMECGRTAPCSAHRAESLCRAGTVYGGVNRDIVHQMKYAGGRGLALTMGRLLAEHFAPPEADFLVPVPLHIGSERDYNQAELMAEGAAGVWGIEVRTALSWSAVVERQVERSGAKRSLRGGVMVLDGTLPVGCRVFLIDDIYTTGSTLRAARSALAERGVDVAGAMVWARSGLSLHHGS